jgi:hypothetical protein
MLEHDARQTKILSARHIQWCNRLFSSIEEAKMCSNRGGLDLKFKAIEEMRSFLHPQKGHICADLLCQLTNQMRKKI